eukprot:TRINITY_DN3481_c0_g1_i2.p1 TRINITY_DN3481_c0_g1~~TRINITY_DN3481_c0_g1_i2.p1  ORF type:complete len:766 (-),score=275.69 TRINITY_DN3481_c0_g1_i2:76-2067(-)
MQTEAKGHHEEVTKLRTTMADMSSHIKELEDTVASKIRINDTLREKNASLQESVADMEENISSANVLIRRYENELELLRIQLEVMESKERSLKAEFSEMEGGSKQVATQSDAKEGDGMELPSEELLSSYEREIEYLKAALARCQSEIRNLSLELESKAGSLKTDASTNTEETSISAVEKTTNGEKSPPRFPHKSSSSRSKRAQMSLKTSLRRCQTEIQMLSQAIVHTRPEDSEKTEFDKKTTDVKRDVENTFEQGKSDELGGLKASLLRCESEIHVLSERLKDAKRVGDEDNQDINAASKVREIGKEEDGDKDVDVDADVDDEKGGKSCGKKETEAGVPLDEEQTEALKVLEKSLADCKEEIRLLGAQLVQKEELLSAEEDGKRDLEDQLSRREEELTSLHQTLHHLEGEIKDLMNKLDEKGSISLEDQQELPLTDVSVVEDLKEEIASKDREIGGLQFSLQRCESEIQLLSSVLSRKTPVPGSQAVTYEDKFVQVTQTCPHCGNLLDKGDETPHIVSPMRVNIRQGTPKEKRRHSVEVGMSQHEYQLREIDEVREMQQFDREAPPTQIRPSTAGSIRGGHVLAFHDDKYGVDIGLFQTRGVSESSQPVQGISDMLRERKKKQRTPAKSVSPPRSTAETFYPSAIESLSLSKHGPLKRDAFTK